MNVRGTACPCHPCQIRFASTYVLRMVNRGTMLPAKDLFCVDCGGRARDYDHYIDYQVQNLLAVHPVCRPCHQKRTVSRRSSTCKLGHPYAHRKNGDRYCRVCHKTSQDRNDRARAATRLAGGLPRRASKARSRVVTIEEGLRRLALRSEQAAKKASA